MSDDITPTLLKLMVMDRAIACLILEVPGAVFDDVSAKWTALRAEIRSALAIKAALDAAEPWQGDPRGCGMNIGGTHVYFAAGAIDALRAAGEVTP